MYCFCAFFIYFDHYIMFQALANACFMANKGKWLSKVRLFLACGGKSLSNVSSFDYIVKYAS